MKSSQHIVKRLNGIAYSAFVSNRDEGMWDNVPPARTLEVTDELPQ